MDEVLDCFRHERFKAQIKTVYGIASKRKSYGEENIVPEVGNRKTTGFSAEYVAVQSRCSYSE